MMALSVLSRTFSGFELMHLPIGTEESWTNFKFLSEDIIVNIFSRLEEDPRYLARLACVCHRFLHVVRNVCWKRHCIRHVPELLPSRRIHPDAMAPPPGGWGGLMKLLVCCPGLKHAGVLLECWDFGLDRELGSSAQYNSHHVKPRRKGKRRITGCQGEGSGEAKESYKKPVLSCFSGVHGTVSSAQQNLDVSEHKVETARAPMEVESCQDADGESKLNSRSSGDITWPISFKEVAQSSNLGPKNNEGQSSWMSDQVSALRVDDIDPANPQKRKEMSGAKTQESAAMRELSPCLAVNFNSCDKFSSYTNKVKMQERMKSSRELGPQGGGSLVTRNDHLRDSQASHCANTSTERASHETEQHQFTREGDREFKPLELHLAAGARNLSREQGNKLLASRFRADCLFICDWPGCEHPGEKRKYKLFRGIFKDFKTSHVWRNLKDMKARPIDVPCAFCNSSSSWDMMTAFCLRRSFEYHDDGEPVVRAYVCENGHVSGAWTDRPLYTF